MNSITLIDLIKEKDIMIPEIQRDYVQGRDEIGAKAKILNFTKTLVNKVVEYDEKIPETQLVLNFVYGNKIKDSFLPLDGQQRLTTLYLLHLFVWSNAEKETDVSAWKSFDYQVRPTSNRFIKSLREHLEDLREDGFKKERPFAKLIIAGEKVTKYDQELNDLSVFLETECFLVNRPWFKRSWLNDLTVRSAIIALYLIKDAFKENVKNLNKSDFEKYAEKLRKGAIVFKYLDIANDLSHAKNDQELLSKSNQIYVKMNARGKPLTPFENIKAELYEKIGPKISNNFKKKVDSDWLLCFFDKSKFKDATPKAKKKQLSKTDDSMMAMFHSVAFNRYILSMQEKGRSDLASAKGAIAGLEEADNYKKISERYDALIGKRKVSAKAQTDIDDEDSFDEEDNQNPVYTFLKRPIRITRIDDFIPKGCNNTILENIVKDFEVLMDFLNSLNYAAEKEINKLLEVDKDGTLQKRYNERLILSSWIKFLHETESIPKNDQELYFKQWTKLFGFILEHSEIDKPEKFLDAINRINNNDSQIFKELDSKTLYENLKENLFHLPDDKTNNETGNYDRNQVADEVRKAGLRFNSQDWEESICNSEKSPVFAGQSIFLIDDSITVDKYKEYWELTMTLIKDSSVTGSLVHRLFATMPISDPDSPSASILNGGVISIKATSKFPSYGHKDDKHHKYDWFAIFENKAYVMHYETLLKAIIRKKSTSTSHSTVDAANEIITNYQNAVETRMVPLSDNYKWLRYMMSFEVETESQFKNTNYNFELGTSLVLKGTQKNIGIDVKLAALMAKHNGEIDWGGESPKVVFKKINAEATYDNTKAEYKINGTAYNTWQDADAALSSVELSTTSTVSTSTTP